MIQVPQPHPPVLAVRRVVADESNGLRETVWRQRKVDVVSDRRHKRLRHLVLVCLYVRRGHEETGPARLDVLDDLEVVAGRQVHHQIPAVAEFWWILWREGEARERGYLSARINAVFVVVFAVVVVHRASLTWLGVGGGGVTGKITLSVFGAPCG